MNKTKYFVEFESSGSDEPYVMQSKFFNTRVEAIMWYKDSFEYVDMDKMNVSLMEATINEHDELVGDIQFLLDITAIFYLKNDINDEEEY